MDRTTQYLAWRVLPAEFRKEVKEIYNADDPLVFPTENELFDYIFGEHNLTSDAEGEMLYADKNKVQKIFAGQTEVQKSTPCGTILHHEAAAQAELLYTLFGSKCLPDEEHPKQKDCDNPLADKEGCKWRNDGKCTFDSACYYEPLNPQEPKPTKPTETFTDDCNSKSKTTSMSTLNQKNVEYLHIASKESHYRNLSQETANCDKQFDAIIKDGFAKERRLNIAAMAMAGILSKGELADPDEVTDMALIYADELIEKCEEGGTL